MYYSIANIIIKVEKIALNRDWELFKANGEKSYQLECVGCDNPEIVHGMECFVLKRNIKHITRVEREVMLSDEKWTSNFILPPYNYKIITSFFLQAFYTQAVYEKMLQFHAALVQYRNSGLMFLGPSGIGKTTQAQIWNRYKNAIIINGDITFVQETPDAFLGWGTPWHGSSPYCENTSVPVKALIVLKQAQENSIRELIGFEKVTAVSNNVFYPRWLEGGMELCLETLNHLLSALPVYELSCRPDEEAVRLTEEVVFGGSV